MSDMDLSPTVHKREARKAEREVVNVCEAYSALDAVSTPLGFAKELREIAHHFLKIRSYGDLSSSQTQTLRQVQDLAGAALSILDGARRSVFEIPTSYLDDLRRVSMQIEASISEKLAGSDLRDRRHSEDALALAVAKAVQIEVARHELAFRQTESLNDELRSRLQKLVETEAEVRKRTTALSNDTADALNRMQRSEEESRKAIQDFQDRLVKWNADWDKQVDGSRREASDLIEELRSLKTEAKDLLQVVGENGASAGYRQEADNSKRSRFWWQIFTVAFFCLWICASVWAFHLTKDLPLTWPLAARQFVVSLPFVLLSAFGALQVSRANAGDLSNQRAALEIHALGPLLAGLPEADQVRVRQTIIPRFFGMEIGRPVERSENADTAEVLSLLDKLSALFKKS